MQSFRVGLGSDHHRLQDSDGERKLLLGGVMISDELMLIANSDGDVVIHALCNAILTAMGEGSFSKIADNLFYNEGQTDSAEYLIAVMDLLKTANFQINNISINVEAKRPHLEEHGVKIKNNLAKLCDISTNQIGIAFTTGEGLTACGRGEGIAAQVMVSLIKD